eukprot:CAMPEP_0115646152 /NCGR_PEP_ID=MMETSP0272-20121206/38775_1 /TAXON_ID=71861 /ORGANISM="Scrippsiella trochoidea, Strain CCMP3099" /LENGTH=56 /DNA_ID=CAMNT_0003083655 /DNA_START=520 /DNA_END=687 /DNA_ORIENTATION=+
MTRRVVVARGDDHGTVGCEVLHEFHDEWSDARTLRHPKGASARVRHVILRYEVILH